MTARSHETIRVGLRRIIRDPNATVDECLQATRLLISCNLPAAHVSCEHHSSIHESAYDLKPESFRQAEDVLFMSDKTIWRSTAPDRIFANGTRLSPINGSASPCWQGEATPPLEASY